MSGEQVRISGGKKNPDLETLNKFSKENKPVVFYLEGRTPISVIISSPVLTNVGIIGPISTNSMKVKFLNKIFEIKNYNPKSGKGYIQII